MNSNIIIFIIIFMFIYYNYNKIFQKIEDNTIYKIGVINDNNINSVTNKILNFYNLQYDNNIKIIKYDDNNDLLKDLNTNNINFAINVENNFIDAVLGLNNFENKKLQNINFCSGLYYNFYYFISNVFFKDSEQYNKINNINDLLNFYEINNRHYIIGTQSTKSLSFLAMIMVLNLYKFIPVDINKKEKNKDYGPEYIFYSTNDIESLTKKFIKNEIDGLFLVRTYKDKNIKFIADNKETIFMNMDFNNTIFDSIFSNYFIKKEIDISFFNEDDIINSSFETRSNRVILISNKYTDPQIVENLVSIYYENNIPIINSLYTNKNLYKNHNLFEPLEMYYINKNIKINEGAHNYYEKNNFIEDKNTKQKYENFKYYWKYDKIGLNKFKL